MSHVSKVASLAATVLLAAGGIALAADPQPVTPSKQATPAPIPAVAACAFKPCPDLVPWKGGQGGGIGVKKFSCGDTQSGKVLYITLGIRNSGTAKTTVPVKTLVKVDGAVWNNPNNPHTTAAEMWPNQWQEFQMTGPAPAPILGTHTLWVMVDSDQAQLESNEGNNVATATTSCK